MRTDGRAGADARTESDGTADGCECGDDGEVRPVSVAARGLRLLKLVATTLAALLGVAKALGVL